MFWELYPFRDQHHSFIPGQRSTTSWDGVRGVQTWQFKMEATSTVELQLHRKMPIEHFQFLVCSYKNDKYNRKMNTTEPDWGFQTWSAWGNGLIPMLRANPDRALGSTRWSLILMIHSDWRNKPIHHQSNIIQTQFAEDLRTSRMVAVDCLFGKMSLFVTFECGVFCCKTSSLWLHGVILSQNTGPDYHLGNLLKSNSMPEWHVE